MLRFSRELDDTEWRAASRAPGWRVQDVVTHLAAGCRAVFTPAVLSIMRSRDIERTNDEFVDRCRDWPPRRTLAEYERWSARLATAAGVVGHGPVSRIPLPLAELGRFPAGLLLAGAMTFDHHTHLRHDMAPALGRPVPGTDAARMGTVLEWMFAVLRNQLRSADPSWLTRPLDVVLDGPGGGGWRVGPGPVVAAGVTGGAAATITCPATDFPEWATCRAAWRDRDVRISGDAEYAARFLDSVRVV